MYELRWDPKMCTIKSTFLTLCQQCQLSRLKNWNHFPNRECWLKEMEHSYLHSAIFEFLNCNSDVWSCAVITGTNLLQAWLSMSEECYEQTINLLSWIMTSNPGALCIPLASTCLTWHTPLCKRQHSVSSSSRHHILDKPIVILWSILIVSPSSC